MALARMRFMLFIPTLINILFLSIRVGSIFPLFQNHDQQLVYTIKGR